MFIALAFFVLLFPLLLVFGPSIKRDIPFPNIVPRVTIIIAAKNEADNILDCFRSVFLQNYPSNKLDIVFVDDGSTDRTAWYLREMTRFSNVRVLTLSGNNGKKAGALNFALDQINLNASDYILFTDADCRVSPNWVTEMVRQLQCTDVVGGVTNVISDASIISLMQRFEWSIAFKNVALLQALFKLSPAIMGNNLGVKASFFIEGIRFKQNAWVEDVCFVNELRGRGASVTLSPFIKVETLPEQGINEIVSQRRRWFRGLKFIPLATQLLLILELLALPAMVVLFMMTWKYAVAVYLLRYFLFSTYFYSVSDKASFFSVFVYDVYQFVVRVYFVLSTVFRRELIWR